MVRARAALAASLALRRLMVSSARPPILSRAVYSGLALSAQRFRHPRLLLPAVDRARGYAGRRRKPVPSKKKDDEDEDEDELKGEAKSDDESEEEDIPEPCFWDGSDCQMDDPFISERFRTGKW